MRLGKCIQDTNTTEANLLETLQYKGALSGTHGVFSMDYDPGRYGTDDERLDLVDITFRRGDTNTICDVDSFAINMDLLNRQV